MSNILIIKHGSLGDLIQANGAIEDIKKNNKKSNVVLLTSHQYFDFMKKCPYVDEVIVDRRLPRWNLFYIHKLKKYYYLISLPMYLTYKTPVELNFIENTY
ncbi:hypothetical protein N9J56_00225 [Pelagibacteraceae bacterium]|nr:hypothetical protein [Pelagibacteraceae bacterium]